jgi:hypothetical protein
MTWTHRGSVIQPGCWVQILQASSATHKPHSPNPDGKPAAFANLCRHAAIVSILHEELRV